MKPYYDDGKGIVIYHADCRDVLPSLDPPYCFLTDPMYGIDGARGNGNRKRGKARYEPVGWEDTETYVQTVAVPTIELLSQRALRGAVTPGNRCMWYYPPPQDVGCFWSPGAVSYGPWGLILFHPILYYGRDFRAGKGGWPTGRQLNEAGPKNGHPCAKPEKAWRWLCAKVAQPGETVIDPFMGSGTTLRAAKDLGCSAIGIEIEECWCELAARRLSQEVLPLELGA